MDLLFEGRLAVYGCLIFGWVGLFLIWTFAKFNHFITTTLAIAFLLASYWILDTLVITNKENAELELADISNLKSFEGWLARNQADKLVKEIIFWDIENIGPGTDKNTSKISSMVKVKGNWGGIQEGIYRVEFLFQNKKDGAPSILSFQIFDPINQNNRLEIGI